MKTTSQFLSRLRDKSEALLPIVTVDDEMVPANAESFDNLQTIHVQNPSLTHVENNILNNAQLMANISDPGSYDGTESISSEDISAENNNSQQDKSSCSTERERLTAEAYSQTTYVALNISCQDLSRK